jgi:hypothetical protein
MLRTSANKALRLIKRVLHKWVLHDSDAPITKFKKEKWEQTAQDGEFRFHLKNKWRPSSAFMDQTSKLFSHFGFSPDDYKEKVIIDLGGGSKLRTKYFIDARIFVIEPLADRFLREIDWCDLAEAERIYSTSAEEHIEACDNMADLVISINVLDHCYNFEAIIKNIVAYLKKDGLAFVSFDKHDGADKMHPLRLTEEICERLFSKNGLTVENHSKGAGEVLKTYGHGNYCLNYWLRKA